MKAEYLGGYTDYNINDNELEIKCRLHYLERIKPERDNDKSLKITQNYYPCHNGYNLAVAERRLTVAELLSALEYIKDKYGEGAYIDIDGGIKELIVSSQESTIKFKKDEDEKSYTTSKSIFVDIRTLNEER